MNIPSNKKAVHVKWAGKTIALGTFPLAEADEKCARAKALTRAWRSTMRPKPTREWVMAELERLNVRVVSGRPAKEGEEDDGNGSAPVPANNNMDGGNNGGVNGSNGNHNRRESITSILNAAEIARGLGLDANHFLSQRRNSSLAMSLFDDNRRDSNLTMGAMSNFLGGGGNADFDTTSGAQNHRPLVGGGSAAAYEAARADHYRKLAEDKNKGKPDVNDTGDRRPSTIQMSLPGTSRRLSSLGSLFNFDSSGSQVGGVPNSSNIGGMNGGSFGGPSVNPNAHYEMLKLHHMNLLNEIQETTLMMNLYQQQQLQQQQQQRKLQQEQQLLAQQQLLSMGRNNIIGMDNQMNQNVPSLKRDTGKDKGSDSLAESEKKMTAELNGHEKQLAKIKAEIEERKRMLAELESASSQKSKRKAKEADHDSDEDSAGNSMPASKKIKSAKL